MPRQVCGNLGIFIELHRPKIVFKNIWLDEFHGEFYDCTNKLGLGFDFLSLPNSIYNSIYIAFQLLNE